MTKPLTLSIGIERYDRHFPFFDGTVKPPSGVNLNVLQVGQSVTLRDGTDRHKRMLKGDFDVGEFSMSTYLMAKGRDLQTLAVDEDPENVTDTSFGTIFLTGTTFDLIASR